MFFKIYLLLEYREQHLNMKYGGKPNPIIDISSVKRKELKNIFISKSDVEHSSTRFFVNEKIYQRLIRNSHSRFVLNVNPNKGEHPKGVYNIPNSVIVKYIETKRDSYNWEKNKTFHQDGIPRDLKSYFN